MMRTIFLLVFLLAMQSAFGQQPQSSFGASSQVCLNERTLFSNSSTGAVRFEWDFCQGDLSLTPSATSITNLAGSVTTGIDVVFDGANWFGFVTSQNTNSVLRLDFGTSVDATPTVVDLGNINGKTNLPTDIKIVEDNGNWYGFVYCLSSSLVTRIDFGTSLKNTTSSPTPILAQYVINGAGSINGGFDMKKVGSTWVMVLTSNASYSVVNFSSITALPSAGDILSGIANPFAVNLGDIALQKSNGNYYGYSVDFNNKSLHRLSFGSNIFSIPSISSLSVPVLANLSPYGIDIGEDNSNYTLVISTLQGELVRVSLGSDLSISSTSSSSLGTLSLLENNLKIKLIKDKSSWRAFTPSWATTKLFKISFPNATCPGTFSPVIIQNSPIVSYTTAGLFAVTLRAFNGLGQFDESTKAIAVSSILAPTIDFNYTSACVNTSNAFTPLPASLSLYNWNFGDGNASAFPQPGHTYSSTGDFSVSLIVQDVNGCLNRADKIVSIFNLPTADFTVPAISPLCTNQKYVFTNQSTFDTASNPTWEWRLNGTLVAGTQNLTQAFTSTTAQEIRLKAKIPGCENEIIKNVTTVLPGPLSNFTFTNGCQASPVSFTNTTSGSVTSYSWIFGDGNTSSLSNASNTYVNIGSYDVTLQANNAAGCQNSVTKSISIYSTPQPDFSIGLPPFSCAGSASQFTDATPAPTDSNITNWTWGFGDAANGTSFLKNPSYTYAIANTYNVSLAVATNFGCTNTIQKSVTISPSPVAGFSNLPACVNQTTQFTDISSGSIKSRLWQIQSNTFSTANPQYTFPASGTFPVVLTVTGNNNCVGQASKNIVVPIVPSLDFSVQAPCANSPTVFTELTTSVDPSISKSWSFGSQGTGSGSPVQYTFSSTGTYVVQLNSTRQSGCVYSVSKNVSIVSPPVADFVPSIDAGAAPLPVSFANNSSGANSYLWKFGDQGNSTSVLVSPTFVFSELGSYNVELSASNSLGCTNRLSKPISVVVPNVDAEMTDFFFVKDPKTGSLQPVVRLLNRSNITLTNPIILLDVAGGSGVSQQLTGAIKPNQEVSQMLDLKLVPKTNQYVCAEVVIAGDVDTFLNRKCLSLSGEEVLFAPFPNPAREQLNMDWISIDGSAVTFQVLTSAGAVSFQQTISSINPGLNRLVINTSTLLSGTYFIRFRDRTNDRTFSLVVLGN
jgi:PKD repeat protein